MSTIDKVYLIHHSHTDLGFTHDNPIVWDLHGRFIEEGIRLATKYAESSSDGAFRWTVENTAVLYEWLKHASSKKVQQFIQLEHMGRIEVTGMYTNMTPLADADQLVESFQLVGKLRQEYGFTIQSAMNCDVNGETWPLVDVLLDMGIEGFTMAINTHYGGAPLDRPDVFWWQGPSGRKIKAYNGFPYYSGLRFGIGQSEAMLEDWWQRIQSRLDQINYPLPVLMIQSVHPFGDNGTAYEGFTTFIDQWNVHGKVPKLILATPRMWWDAVKPYSQKLPTYRGDWTDFWNFGCISSASEQETNRNNRIRLRNADAIAAATLGLAVPLPTANIARTLDRYRESAWRKLNLWDEHTWGADLSMLAPDYEDTKTQWNHKAQYAYQARSLSLMLQRDALADFSNFIPRESMDDLLLFNTLPWARSISGEVPSLVATPRGLPEDATSGRHFQDRIWWSPKLWDETVQMPSYLPSYPRLCVAPIEVPGYGFVLLKRSNLVELKPGPFSEEAIVENERFRLTFDTVKGGVTSWYDLQIDREWVDQTAGYPLNGFVHEEVADHTNPWPRQLLFQLDLSSDQVEIERGWKCDWKAVRRQPSRVLTHRAFRTPLGIHVIQVLEAPAITGSLVQSVFLPQGEDYIEFESWWTMTQTSHPEATYLIFPFNIPMATTRIDLGGQAMIAGLDQLPGVCYDYYTAQQWVDFSNQDFGVTVALPENPMVQFGDFHFGANQRNFNLERAMLLGWVTNTFWEVNFRAHQPGGVHARYRIKPRNGGFNPIAANRFGLEAAASQLLLQHMGEPALGDPVFPKTGALLHFPETIDPAGPVYTRHFKPASKSKGIVVRLYNDSDSEMTTQIGSGLLQIISAQTCDLVENPLHPLEVSDGMVKVIVPSRRIFTILLSVEPGYLNFAQNRGEVPPD